MPRGPLLPDDLVPHPRFGSKVVPSGETVSERDVRASYFAYKTAVLFPESAIAADISRQNFSTFPRGYYVDLLERCVRCKRPFIFFAREQKYWYEDLHFYIDSRCVHCAACRASIHELRDRLKRYGENKSRTDLDDDALELHAEDALFLWEHGLFHQEKQIRTLRNTTHRRIPTRAISKQLDELVGRLGK